LYLDKNIHYTYIFNIEITLAKACKTDKITKPSSSFYSQTPAEKIPQFSTPTI